MLNEALFLFLSIIILPDSPKYDFIKYNKGKLFLFKYISKRAYTLQPTLISGLFITLIINEDSASQNPVTNQESNFV